MAADRSLATLLRALQHQSSENDALRLLFSATSLLATLTNPLNITLLTSQLLIAPAIWANAADLNIPLRVLSTFNSAAQISRDTTRIRRAPSHHPHTDQLNTHQWVRAVTKGADSKTPGWRHLLVLGGLICGLRIQEDDSNLTDLHLSLEQAMVKITNHVLQEPSNLEEIAAGTICLTLGHALKHLRPASRRLLQGDRLLIVVTHQLLRSKQGLHWGYVLCTVDHDVCPTGDQHFSWSPSSPSFYQLQKMSNSPLISLMGSLSQLWALCVELTADVRVLQAMLDELLDFSRSLAVQWRQNKLSELDKTEERDFLDKQTLEVTLPLLWQILRSVVFASVIVVQPIIGRALRDVSITSTQQLIFATQILSILRNLYFVSSRLGHHAFDQYTFVYMCAVDIVSKRRGQIEEYLTGIRPQNFDAISAHPLDRCLDLFFFNIAEHFALLLSPQFSESVLLPATKPYLHSGIDARLLENFEAAHSVILSVFSGTQSIDLFVQQAPAYTHTLLSSFPGNLSARQFRLAMKTLVRIASPPGPSSQVNPFLASSIMEAIHLRLQAATEVTLPLPTESASGHPADELLTHKAALLLTLIDSLPVLAPSALRDWIPVIGADLGLLDDPSTEKICQERLWEVLSNGEMDVPRAEVCVDWWNNQDGRQALLGHGKFAKSPLTMSGALPETSKL